MKIILPKKTAFQAPLGGDQSCPVPPSSHLPGLTTKLLSIAQVADQLSVSQVTVRRWIKAGKIPAFKLGHPVRVKQEDLNKLIEAAGV